MEASDDLRSRLEAFRPGGLDTAAWEAARDVSVAAVLALGPDTYRPDLVLSRLYGFLAAQAAWDHRSTPNLGALPRARWRRPTSGSCEHGPGAPATSPTR